MPLQITVFPSPISPIDQKFPDFSGVFRTAPLASTGAPQEQMLHSPLAYRLRPAQEAYPLLTTGPVLPAWNSQVHQGDFAESGSPKTDPQTLSIAS